MNAFYRDKRIMLLISLSCFIIYQIFTLPWPFYEGPLDYIELGNFDACVTYCKLLFENRE